jgi:hypothetical protein
LISLNRFSKNTRTSNQPNLSSGSLGFECGQTDTDTTKLTAAFCNFVNAPKIYKQMYRADNKAIVMEKAKSLQNYEVKSGIVQQESEDFTGS